MRIRTDDETVTDVRDLRIAGGLGISTRTGAANQSETAVVISSAPTHPTVYNPNGLRRWRAALGNALLGSASITCIGDSITMGVGSDGNSTAGNSSVGASTYRLASWDAQLRSLFAKTFGVSGECWIGYGQIPGEFAGRITLASGASGGTYGPFEQGCKAASGQTITLATLDACTEIHVWVWDGSSTTTATYAVDGGGSSNLGAGTGVTSATTWTKRTITGLSSTTHSVVISGPASGTVFIAGFVALNQTTGVRVHCMGLSGYTTANVLGLDSVNGSNTAAQARSLKGIGVVPASDLVIVALGVNDFGGQNATASSNGNPGTIPSTYKSNLQTIVSQVVASGACCLLVGSPRQCSVSYPSPMTYSEDQYYIDARDLALATDHCAFVDIGEVWGSWTDGNSLGLYTSNSVHPTQKGHGDYAQILYDVLTRKYLNSSAA